MHTQSRSHAPTQCTQDQLASTWHPNFISVFLVSPSFGSLVQFGTDFCSEVKDQNSFDHHSLLALDALVLAHHPLILPSLSWSGAS